MEEICFSYIGINNLVLHFIHCSNGAYCSYYIYIYIYIYICSEGFELGAHLVA